MKQALETFETLTFKYLFNTGTKVRLARLIVRKISCMKINDATSEKRLGDNFCCVQNEIAKTLFLWTRISQQSDTKDQAENTYISLMFNLMTSLAFIYKVNVLLTNFHFNNLNTDHQLSVCYNSNQIIKFKAIWGSYDTYRPLMTMILCGAICFAIVQWFCFSFGSWEAMRL